MYGKGFWIIVDDNNSLQKVTRKCDESQDDDGEYDDFDEYGSTFKIVDTSRVDILNIIDNIFPIEGLTNTVLDYADYYRSIEHMISPDDFNIDPEDEEYSSDDLEKMNMEQLTEIVHKLGIHKKFGLKDGDVLRWDNNDYRNHGRMIYFKKLLGKASEQGKTSYSTTCVTPVLWDLYTKIDDYGTVWPEMTANYFGSSTYFEYTVDGHSNCIPFDSTDYQIKETIKIDHPSYCGIAVLEHNKNNDRWFILFNKNWRKRFEKVKKFYYDHPSYAAGDEEVLNQFPYIPRHRVLYYPY